MDYLLGLAFGALSVLFAVWIAITVTRYSHFLRLASSSLLTWRPPRPWFFNLCLGIGFFMVVMTIVSAFVLRRPPLHIVAQALMAVFYTAVFPLGFRIQRGFYATGIWSERGFIPYRRIRWLGWKERPDILLALRTDRGVFGQGYSFLRVPGKYYGQARRILRDRIKDRSLSLETSVLGLDTKASTGERV
ncbi:MAG: hypothetical protein ACE5JI_06295 [Acidobacteriota bacterium]